MEKEIDLVQEFDNIVEGYRKRSLKAMWIGYVIGIAVGSVVTYYLIK